MPRREELASEFSKTGRTCGFGAAFGGKPSASIELRASPIPQMDDAQPTIRLALQCLDP
jgi:hypothetical protein